MVKNFLNHLNFYCRFRIQLLKAKMANRGDFITFVFCDFIIQILNLLFFNILFTQIDSIKGWNYEQLIFIYAISMLSYGIFNLLFWGVYDHGYMLHTGMFDQILLKPYNALFQSSIREIGDLGGVVIGSMLLIYSMNNGIFQASLINIILLVFCVLCSSILLLAIHAIIAGFSFWMDNTSGILLGYFSIVLQFSRYPITIFGPMIAFCLTFIIPISFIGYYPAIFFMSNKLNTTVLYLPLITVVFVLVALLQWKIGVRRYAGSAN